MEDINILNKSNYYYLMLVFAILLLIMNFTHAWCTYEENLGLRSCKEMCDGSKYLLFLFTDFEIYLSLL